MPESFLSPSPPPPLFYLPPPHPPPFYFPPFRPPPAPPSHSENLSFACSSQRIYVYRSNRVGVVMREGTSCLEVFTRLAEKVQRVKNKHIQYSCIYTDTNTYMYITTHTHQLVYKDGKLAVFPSVRPDYVSHLIGSQRRPQRISIVSFFFVFLMLHPCFLEDFCRWTLMKSSRRTVPQLPLFVVLLSLLIIERGPTGSGALTAAVVKPLGSVLSLICIILTPLFPPRHSKTRPRQWQRHKGEWIIECQWRLCEVQTDETAVP